MPNDPVGYVVEGSTVPVAIAPVPTSIAAFIGRASRGPCDRPIAIRDVGEFEREFGGLWAASPLSNAVQHFFQNGGREALVVRVHHAAAAATLTLPCGLALRAASEGAWGAQLRVRVDHDTRPLEPGEPADSLFQVTIKDAGTGVVEVFADVSTDPGHPRFITHVLNAQSRLVRVTGEVPAVRPPASDAPSPGGDPLDAACTTPFGADGDDGLAITDAQIADPALASGGRGLWALDGADLVNLICVPPLAPGVDVSRATWDTAVAYARRRRAMVIVDAPASWTIAANAHDGVDGVVTRDANAALYFPRVLMADPLDATRVAAVAPCGAIAGIMARTDSARGVWKAPAGSDATLVGATGLSLPITDAENSQLNPLAVNCLRVFNGHGVVWGSRTLMGADALASEWKYVPVRRLALFIEESVARGTRWATFEPNEASLWTRVRQSAEMFLHGLFTQGALAGRTPREAYVVRCGLDTMTQDDIDNGRLVCEIGIAPLKPAEFVIIRIQHTVQATQA
ncbi:MAG: phage tail sheath subtilisin-like domain-containing protein [Vicinamibacterales bacterium]